jgi:hypothetical protein
LFSLPFETKKGKQYVIFARAFFSLLFSFRY